MGLRAVAENPCNETVIFYRKIKTFRAAKTQIFSSKMEK